MSGIRAISCWSQIILRKNHSQSKQHNVVPWYILWIYYVYALYITNIYHFQQYLNLARIHWSYGSRKKLNYMNIALDYRATTQLYPKDKFYSNEGYTRYIAGYTMYMPCIYQTKVTCQCWFSLLPTLVWQPQTGLSSYLLRNGWGGIVAKQSCTKGWARYMYIQRITTTYTCYIHFIYHENVHTLTNIPRNQWCSILNW